MINMRTYNQLIRQYSLGIEIDETKTPFEYKVYDTACGKHEYIKTFYGIKNILAYIKKLTEKRRNK